MLKPWVKNMMLKDEKNFKSLIDGIKEDEEADNKGIDINALKTFKNLDEAKKEKIHALIADFSKMN